MATVHNAIDGRLAEFITQQHMFFVGTAPSGGAGHVNISPKGLDSFRVIDPETVAYLDLTGSGVETISHLRENGRIVFMFCAFEGPPNIVRLHGTGTVVTPGDAGFAELAALFPPLDGVRAVIRAQVHRVSDSCGYAVPLYEFKGDRSQLSAWACHKGDEGLEQYRAEKNARSIDGLSGL
ncbi:MAG: pyridoxamine 5'-phosphate oxidase family protein [Tepidiformaceae bacterium]